MVHSHGHCVQARSRVDHVFNQNVFFLAPLTPSRRPVKCCQKLKLNRWLLQKHGFCVFLLCYFKINDQNYPQWSNCFPCDSSDTLGFLTPRLAALLILLVICIAQNLKSRKGIILLNYWSFLRCFYPWWIIKTMHVSSVLG